jgi:hypothetical protein
MNNVRLECGGQIIDLPTDFGILINKSIADIREPESRSSDWSKTFTLPGTKRNNKLFTHLFDLNLSIRNTTATNFSPDFNPNLKATASLYVDEVTQIEGFIRLLNINVTDRHQIQYECTMHGQLADLFTTMADGKLADLNFSEYNHTINSTNIFNSWDTSIVKNGSSGYVNFSGGKPTGDGYVYTWLDNGEYPDYKTMYTDNMSVCLYAKTIVDKIFSGAGYTYTSDSFFNTDLFKRLVIPCPTHTPQITESEVLSRQFLAEKNSNQAITIPAKVTFTNEITDPSGQYNQATSEWTVGKTGIYDLFIYNKSTLSSIIYSGTGAQRKFKCLYSIYVNGVRKAVRDGLVVYGNTANIPDSVSFDETIIVGEALQLNQNDVVTIYLDNVVVSNVTSGWQLITSTSLVSSYTFTQSSGSKFYNQVVDSVGYNGTMDFSGFFTDETKQSDFVKWLFVAFNLYCEPDQDFRKKLLIKSREEFYGSTVRDWTMKRDLLQPLEIIPMGELEAGKYVFSYAEGDDEGNKDYKDDFNRVYGDRQFTVQNDFIKDEKKIEIGFAPSILNSFPGEDKVLTYIDNGDSQEKRFYTGKLRLLQFSGVTCSTYTIFNGKTGSTTSTTKTKYPFTAHIDNPTAPTTDINFGMPRFIGLKPGTPMTNNNLYNAYWSKYIQEVTDKDSKIVKGAFHLTPADMEKLSFQDLYFFDGNYFRLNKIEDYDPVNPSVNICEFLFLKTGQTFTATTGSTGGGGSQGSGGQQEYDPRGGGTSGKVIQQRGVSIGDFNKLGDGIGVGSAINNLGLRNAAFATSGVTFIGDDAIVIGEAPANPVVTGEVWLQGHSMTQLNFSTNRIKVVSGTTAYSPSLYEDILIVNLTANTTINLPEASTATSKAYYIYKNTGAHQLIIDGYAGEYIDGAETFTITNHYECIQIVCDGTAWYVISKK